MIDALIQRYPALSVCMKDILKAEEQMAKTYGSGGKFLVCGNGGSCADADHIVGELMKGFLLKRKMNEETAQKFKRTLGAEADFLMENLQCGIPAVSLPSQSAVLSAYANDAEPSLVYAQLVFGYAQKSDMLIALSTSGNSKNVVAAAKTAKALGIQTLALTGANESRLSEVCDVTVRVPATETFLIQELHLPVYHYLCASLEKTAFGENL